MAGNGVMVVDAYGGLANRMRVLRSGLALARETGHTLKLSWYRSPELNCRFTDLFKPVPSVAAVFQPRTNAVTKELRRFRIRRFAASGFYANHAQVTALLSKKFDFTGLGCHRNVYIRTYSEFYAGDGYTHVFRPVARLQAIIDRVLPGNGPFVGVHIRRGDNDVSRANSGTDHFVMMMQQELHEKPDVRFFLATDSPGDEQRLKREFGERLLTYPKRSLDRNAPEAIRDAMVDLYSLAACGKILGSYWSSFTDMAAQLGGCEKIVVTGDTG